MKKIIFSFLFLAIATISFCQTKFTVNEYQVNLSTYPSYTESQIKTAIQSVKSSHYFDYHYLNSGCNFKSHYVSMWLKSKFNIETFKVWNFAKNNFYYDSYGIQLKMPDPNKLTNNDSIYWGYHVAVALLKKRIDHNRTYIDTVVIDLPTNDLTTIPLSTWLNSQGQSNSYYTFTNRKFCQFETIIPAFYNSQNNLNALKSLPIFAGSFYDDVFSIDSNKVSYALALDIVIMKFYNEIIIPKIQNDDLLKQLYQMREQIPAQRPQMRAVLRGQGLTESQIDEKFKTEDRDLDKRISDKRHEITKAIADVSNLNLPEEYKNQIPQLTIKIQQHIINELRQ